MDEAYFQMMRQNMKMAGMSDAQIDAMIEMQKNAVAAANIDPSVIAATNAQAAAMAESMRDGEYYNNMLDAEDEGFELVENPSVNQSYQWAIACGADLGQLRGDILNDLNTEDPVDGESSGITLENDWGIENHDDAVEMCDSLLSGRHSNVYNEAAKTGTGKYAAPVKEAVAAFVADGLIQAGDVPNMLMWDLGRLVTVSRLAFDAGWLSRDEVLHYLRELAGQVQGAYKSWRDVSVAYQFGRAVWGGMDNYQYEIMKSNMEDLLTQADSPWVKLDFGMKLEF